MKRMVSIVSSKHQPMKLTAWTITKTSLVLAKPPELIAFRISSTVYKRKIEWNQSAAAAELLNYVYDIE